MRYSHSITPIFSSSLLLGATIAGALGLAAHREAHAQSTAGYRIVQTVPLGAPSMWDYVVVDADSHRVYVAQGEGVVVIDGAAGKVIGHVKGLAGGTHGIAISAVNGRGYVDDGENGLVKSFDLKTFAVKKTIKARMDADAVILDPASGHVFVMDGDSGKVTVVDPVSDSAIAELDGGGKLEYAAADGAGSLFINGAGKKEILRVDTRTNAITARWPIHDCESPHGMAIDPATHRVFTSCINQRLVVVNTDTGSIVATLPIGKGSDAVAFDPIRRRVLSSNGIDGTLTVIQQLGADTYRVLETIETQQMGRTMGIDPITGRLFIAAATLDPHGPAVGYPRALPGSLKLLILDPQDAAR